MTDFAIGLLLPLVQWVRVTKHAPEDVPHEALFYRGTFSSSPRRSITFVVTSFEIESQGHPKGSRGCDGMMTESDAESGATMVRLTRPLAERALKLAEEQVKRSAS